MMQGFAIKNPSSHGDKWCKTHLAACCKLYRSECESIIFEIIESQTR
jgi:hypothetical protein